MLAGIITGWEAGAFGADLLMLCPSDNLEVRLTVDAIEVDETSGLKIEQPLTDISIGDRSEAKGEAASTDDRRAGIEAAIVVAVDQKVNEKDLLLPRQSVHVGTGTDRLFQNAIRHSMSPSPSTSFRAPYPVPTDSAEVTKHTLTVRHTSHGQAHSINERHEWQLFNDSAHGHAEAGREYPLRERTLVLSLDQFELCIRLAGTGQQHIIESLFLLLLAAKVRQAGLDVIH